MIPQGGLRRLVYKIEGEPRTQVARSPAYKSVLGVALAHSIQNSAIPKTPSRGYQGKFFCQ